MCGAVQSSGVRIRDGIRTMGGSLFCLLSSCFYLPSFLLHSQEGKKEWDFDVLSSLSSRVKLYLLLCIAIHNCLFLRER